MSVKSKIETVEEYLARGGAIKRLPAGELVKHPDITRKSGASGPAIIMSLEEADLFYGEARKGSKPKKAKPLLKIDFNALPQALNKFIIKLKEEVDGEEDKGEEED